MKNIPSLNNMLYTDEYLCYIFLLREGLSPLSNLFCNKPCDDSAYYSRYNSDDNLKSQFKPIDGVFFFLEFLLICISPPYVYIILYRVRYINIFVKKTYKKCPDRADLVLCLMIIHFYLIIKIAQFFVTVRDIFKIYQKSFVPLPTVFFGIFNFSLWEYHIHLHCHLCLRHVL